jgi:glycine/D-amino acid oxidase-like deaminating enzyme
MTADGAHTVGPVPGVRGLYVAGGCCVGGLSIAPAIRGSAGSVDY